MCTDSFREVDLDQSGTMKFEQFCKVSIPKLNAKDMKNEA